jgi:hypothetical protein
VRRRQQRHPGMNDLDDIFARLAASPFRRRFRLAPSDRAYLARKGLPEVLAHAADFIDKRLAAPNPANDGKQTPFRGHPGDSSDEPRLL